MQQAVKNISLHSTLNFIITLYITPRKYPSLYQVPTLAWMYNLSVTNIMQVTDATLQDLKQKGIDALYLLGVWTNSPYGTNLDRQHINDIRLQLPDCQPDDILGSCFAVVNYGINPNIGTVSDLQQFRVRINELGISLYLDFVPNHSAVDATEAEEHPEHYIKGKLVNSTMQLPNGMYYGRDKYNDIWQDTMQYNLWNPATVTARLNDIMQMAALADGARFDMAMCLLNKDINETWGSILTPQGFAPPEEEFWKLAIIKVKAQNPNFKFVAEAYWRIDELLSQGFDYCYDKDGLYDTMRSKNLSNITSYIQKQSCQTNNLQMGYSPNLCVGTHFIANHDEGQAPITRNFGSEPAANAAGCITFTLPGMRFHWYGQWRGQNKTAVIQLQGANLASIQLRRTYQPEVDFDQPTINFYNTFLPFIGGDMWHFGNFTYRQVVNASSQNNLMGWTWEYGGQNVLAVINFSNTSASGFVKLSVPSGTINFTDILTNETYTRNGDDVRYDGLFVMLKPWGLKYYTTVSDGDLFWLMLIWRRKQQVDTNINCMIFQQNLDWQVIQLNNRLFNNQSTAGQYYCYQNLPHNQLFELSCLNQLTELINCLPFNVSSQCKRCGSEFSQSVWYLSFSIARSLRKFW